MSFLIKYTVVWLIINFSLFKISLNGESVKYSEVKNKKWLNFFICKLIPIQSDTKKPRPTTGLTLLILPTNCHFGECNTEAVKKLCAEVIPKSLLLTQE